MTDPFIPIYDRFGGGACSLALVALGYDAQPETEPERTEAAALVLAYLEGA